MDVGFLSLKRFLYGPVRMHTLLASIQSLSDRGVYGQTFIIALYSNTLPKYQIRCCSCAVAVLLHFWKAWDLRKIYQT